MGVADDFLRIVFYEPTISDLMWHATRPGEVYSVWFYGRHANGERLSYEVPTEPGPIDAGSWCPFDAGGAESYDAA